MRQPDLTQLSEHDDPVTHAANEQREQKSRTVNRSFTILQRHVEYIYHVAHEMAEASRNKRPVPAAEALRVIIEEHMRAAAMEAQALAQAQAAQAPGVGTDTDTDAAHTEVAATPPVT